MQNHSSSSEQPRAELEALQAFEAYLRGRGYASVIIGRHIRFMHRVAQWCRCHDADVLGLHRDDAVPMFRDLIRGYRGSTLSQCRCALERWFDFRGEGVNDSKTHDAAWWAWCEDYRVFLVDHRGLLPDSAKDNVQEAALFMRALFGNAKPCWQKVDAKRIWSYCERCARGAKPSYANKRFHAIGRFCNLSMPVADAVPNWLTPFRT